MEEQEIIEETLETIEKTLDAMENSIDVVKTNKALVVGVGIVALAAGAAIGYFVADKRLRTKYDDVLADQVEEARAFYATLNKADYPTPEALLKERHPEAVAAAEAMETYTGNVPDPRGEIVEAPEDGTLMIRRTEEKEVISRNIFVDGEPIKDDDWDQDAEESTRTPGKPYVITEGEFFQNETSYEQMQMTYYMGDDVLVDETSADVVNKSDEFVGDENLTKFGHGSKDKHIVYIRNDAKELEFEIARSTGKYAVEVLGLGDDEQPARVSRFRGSDD